MLINNNSTKYTIKQHLSIVTSSYSQNNSELKNKLHCYTESIDRKLSILTFLADKIKTH